MKGRDRDNYAMNEAFPRTYHGCEVYLAHRFDNDVGISAGWEQTAFSDHSFEFTGTQNFLNGLQPAGSRVYVESRVEVAHFDVNGYYNFTDNLEALGQIGVGLTRVTAHMYLYNSGVVTNMMPSNNFDNWVPRVSLGLQYFTPWNIGIRTMFNWQGTIVYNMSLMDEDGIRTKIKAFDQSWIFSLGIVGRF